MFGTANTRSLEPNKELNLSAVSGGGTDEGTELSFSFHWAVALVVSDEVVRDLDVDVDADLGFSAVVEYTGSAFLVRLLSVEA